MSILDELYPEVEPPLRFENPYQLLIAAMLSANSTDRVVNRVCEVLFRMAPSPMHIHRMPLEKLIKIIKPCGLSKNKARNIKKTTEIIIKEYGGQVPANRVELLNLPGVGMKVASVVLSQAFGIPAFPVDTHIFRLMRRWGLSKGRTPEAVMRDCMSIFPENKWNKLHLQIIYYGREYCRAKGHSIEKCVICRTLASQFPSHVN